MAAVNTALGGMSEDLPDLIPNRFDILEVEYDPSGDVVSFAADFEQHCEGDDPALFGSIHYNSTLAIFLPRRERGFSAAPHASLAASTAVARG
jgi:hypothetical protein